MSEGTTRNLPQDGVELILARLDTLDARLTTLEDKVDRRLQETRPIWELVLTRLDGIENGLDGVESRLTALEGETRTLREEVRSSLSQFELQVEVLTRDVRDVRAKQLDLDRRVARLEEKPAP